MFLAVLQSSFKAFDVVVVFHRSEDMTAAKVTSQGRRRAIQLLRWTYRKYRCV